MKKIGFAIGVLLAVWATVSLMNFIDFGNKWDAGEAQAAQVAHDRAIDSRLIQAKAKMDSLEAWAVKEARFYMREAQVRAVVDVVRVNADDALKVDLILRLIDRESRWNPRAIGKIGEVGLLQVLPSTVGMTRAELLDPATNIRAGVGELKRLYTKFGDVALTLVAFGTGENSPALRGVKYVLFGGEKP